MANKPLVSTISDNYKILKVLGQGCYGQVIHCLKQDTIENVAVKVLKERGHQRADQREMYILKKLRGLDPEKNSIVRCHEWFQNVGRTFMVFEMLDMSVCDYLHQTRHAPLPLRGIRTIIKDVATALNALKSFGLIHTDLKTDNIMLVNHQAQPFRTKLIDFGLTLEKSEVWPGMTVQPLWSRAPEVIVGFPFTEAIDTWSLGTVMAELLLGFPLFPGKHEYDVLRFIIDLLGELPKRLLNRGRNTASYYYSSFKFFCCFTWRLMYPYEYHTVTGIRPVETRKYMFSSLESLKTSEQHTGNSAEAAERNDCVELLKEMFQMDPRNRITPSQILEHPFMLGNYLSPSNQCAKELPILVRRHGNTMKMEEATKQGDKEIVSQGGKQNSDCILESVSDISSVSSVTSEDDSVTSEDDSVTSEDDSVTSEDDSVTSEDDSSSNTSGEPMDITIESISLGTIDSNSGSLYSLTTPTSNSINLPPSHEVSEPKKKKKSKKGLRRFFASLKRTFFSCCCVSEVIE